MIQFYSRVKKVERKSRLLRAWKVGDEIKMEEQNLGWFILLEGSWEYLYVGNEEPAFSIGDDVAVTIVKRSEI
jgi:hypothetical protein